MSSVGWVTITEDLTVLDTKRIKRPLNYYGSQWGNVADQVRHVPPTTQGLVTVCGGGASFLLQLPPFDFEIYNDLESGVYNFFKVLRDRPEELITALDFTPFSEEEAVEAIETLRQIDDEILSRHVHKLEPSADLELELARAFVVASWQTRPGSFSERSFRRQVNYGARYTSAASAWSNLPERLSLVAQRLKQVEIWNLDAFECLRRLISYNNNRVLAYVDPPWPRSTRKKDTARYLYEWTDDQHLELAGVLSEEWTGYALVVGRRCSLYETGFESRGWVRYDYNVGESSEFSVWSSPRTVEAAGSGPPVNFGLFGGLDDV